MFSKFESMGPGRGLPNQGQLLQEKPTSGACREAHVARGQRTGETQRNKKKPTFTKILSEQRNKIPTLAAKK